MKLAAESPIWDRIASPAFADVSPQAARAILRMKLRPGDVERIHELSAVARKGSLGSMQKAELDLYLQIGHFRTLMHSKARVALKSGESRKRRKTA